MRNNQNGIQMNMMNKQNMFMNQNMNGFNSGNNMNMNKMGNNNQLVMNPMNQMNRMGMNSMNNQINNQMNNLINNQVNNQMNNQMNQPQINNNQDKNNQNIQNMAQMNNPNLQNQVNNQFNNPMNFQNDPIPDNNPDQDIMILKNGKIKPEHIYIVAKICKSAIESSNNSCQIITQKLKQAFNEEWFVFISEYNEKNFEFKFSEINDEEIMAFRYKNYIVYICSI